MYESLNIALFSKPIRGTFVPTDGPLFQDSCDTLAIKPPEESARRLPILFRRENRIENVLLV